MVKQLSELTKNELKQIKSILKLFEMLGISHEDLEKLSQILQNWDKVCKNVKDMGDDIHFLNDKVSKIEAVKDAKSAKNTDDTYDNIAKMAQLGSSGMLKF